MAIRRLILPAVLATLMGCTDDPRGLSWLEVEVPAIDRYLSTLVDWGFSGTVLLARGDTILLQKGYGFAIPETGVPATADTRYDAGSIAKQFTAGAVLSLVEEGALDLDASLTEVYSDVPQEMRGITIRHLLSHTSGLPREVGRDFQVMTREEFVGLTLEATLQFQPGSGYSYSNAGYALLGSILEERSGRPFQELLNERLFAPFGLTSTGFLGNPLPSRTTARAIGGTLDGQGPDDWIHTWNHRGSGGLVTTVGDLFRWTRRLAAGDILSPYLQQLMETPGESGYGFGISVGESPTGGLRLGHAGLWYAFSSFLFRYPDDGDVTLIVLSNRASSSFQWAMVVGRALEEAVIAGRPRPAPPAVVSSEVEISEFAGTYALAGGESIEVIAEGPVLRIRGDGLITRDALTRAMELERTEQNRLAERTNAILWGFSRSEFTTLDSVAPAARAERYRTVVPPIFRAREDSLGRLLDVRHAGTFAPWGQDDMRQTHAVLRFERGSEGIRLDWSPDGILLGIENESPDLPEFLTVFRPVGPWDFAAYHVETGIDVRVEFRVGAGDPVLVIPRPGSPALELPGRR